jgi:hypothetical protein
VTGVRKLTLCKMCARLAVWESMKGSIALCKECLDYITVMAREEEPLRDQSAWGPRPMPPWEIEAMRRAQEHIEMDLAESMLL